MRERGADVVLVDEAEHLSFSETVLVTHGRAERITQAERTLFVR